MVRADSANFARPYGHLAPNYDATIGTPFFHKTRRAFEKLIRRYGIAFRTAADLGCGAGLFARYLNRSWPVDLITGNFDTLNHLVQNGDLLETFRMVQTKLNAGGHFIFDILLQCGSPAKVHQYGVRFQTAQRQVTQHIRWDPMSRKLAILVSIRSRSTPRRILEAHRERAYSPAEIGNALLDAGFVIRGIHDATTFTIAGHCQPRIIVVATKKQL